MTVVTRAVGAAVLLGLATAASAATGRTAGTFAVSSTGEATYTIPLWATAGPQGIQPQMSLNYSSRSGNGYVGVGWTLGGLSAISRCNRTFAQDTTPASVALVSADGYCLDGNRLRLTGGTYGAAGSTYQTEIADFANVTASGTAGNGPASFTVRTKIGLTFQYGLTDANGNGANSQVLASGTTTADFWYLSKIIDRAGNNLVINYTTLTGTVVPDKIMWTPTSAGASTYAYTMQFNYTSNVPQSSTYQYIGGTPLANTDLLSSVTVAYSGTVIKNYVLGYQTSPTTGREELASVKECADAAATNCLAPTTISYQNGAVGVATSATTAATTATQALLTRYDLNGDGYPDLIFWNGTNVYVAFGSATGYGTPVNTGIATANQGPVGDLTGSGKDGILASNSGTWSYYTWNGSSFTGTSTGIASQTGAFLVDTNGDGLPDLVTTGGGGSGVALQLNTRLNTSTGGAVSFSSTVNVAYDLFCTCSVIFGTPDSAGAGPLRSWDFNGDGRGDLVLDYITIVGSTFTYHFLELLGNGTTFTSSLIATSTNPTSTVPYVVNWNNDQCTDAVWNSNIRISGCNGTAPSTLSVAEPFVTMLDWDGDGRTDVLVANGTTLGVHLSLGNGISTLQSTTIPYSASNTYFTTGINGDGLDDLGIWSGSTVTYRLHNGAGTPPDLATSIADGYGNSASATYVSLVQNNYTLYADATYPDKNYLAPLYVVSQATLSDPSNAPSGNYTQSFWYYGAWMNLQGRGFDGFNAKRTYDSRTQTYRYTYFQRRFPYTGLPQQEDLYQSDGVTLISHTVDTPAVTTLDATINNQRYFPYVSAMTEELREVGGTQNGLLITSRATNFTFDSFGNATTVSQTVTDKDATSPYFNQSWTTSVVNTITPDTGNWCLGLSTQTAVTKSAPGVANITRTVAFTPDYVNCRATQRIVEPASATYKVTETLGFDSFGNINSDQIVGINLAARTTLTNWGTTGQFPMTVTNPLNQVTQYGYAFGLGLRTSAMDPNNIQVSWQYDGFGRKTREDRPDGTATTWAYNDCAASGSCVNTNNKMVVVQTVLNSDGSTQTDQSSYLDRVDRELVTTRRMLSGAYDRQETQYDNLGRIYRKSAPCQWSSCTLYWTTSSYDVLNRVTQIQRPISASNPSLQTTTYAYRGRTTIVTDPQAKTTTQIAQVIGTLGRSQDHNGYYQDFGYDASGSLISVKDSASPANTLFTATYDYGLQAFQRTANDMDRGAWSYGYDSLGELVSFSDAKGQPFSYGAYDGLGRPTTRTEPDLTTTWTWGNSAASHNIGQLQSVTAVGTATYSESYSFDSAGRLINRTITPASLAAAAFDMSYSSTTGLLDTLTYPTSTSAYRLKLQYGYANGVLQTIKDFNALSTVFWTANTVNAFGQVTQETLGNGVVTNRSFDGVTGWLNSLQSGVGGGAGLMNQSYLY
jgi:YD repeat-containing protein